MAWDVFKEDLAATGQRWYCKCCYAKYKTKYGVLAELPPFDIQDAKFMRLERDFKQYTSPEALLAALPNVHPLARGELLKETAFPGHFKFNGAMMKGLEKMNWSQFYNMTGTQVK